MKRSGGPGIGETTTATALRRAVEVLEEEIVQNAFETVALFDAAGTLLLRAGGESNRVSFTIPAELKENVMVITHNHPQGTSFSPEDVGVALRTGVEELRAVSPRYVYVLGPPKAGWQTIDRQALADDVLKTVRTVERQLWNKVQSGQLSEQEAIMLLWHTVWTRVSRRFGFRYRRRERP